MHTGGWTSHLDAQFGRLRAFFSNCACAVNTVPRTIYDSDIISFAHDRRCWWLCSHPRTGGSHTPRQLVACFARQMFFWWQLMFLLFLPFIVVVAFVPFGPHWLRSVYQTLHAVTTGSDLVGFQKAALANYLHQHFMYWIHTACCDNCYD